MADVHKPEVRSFNMSRIKAKNTKPEILVRKHLFSKGIRFRLHDKKLPGKPDIVLPKYKTVIFVHGCFWHGHEGCRFFVVPKTRTEWWVEKIKDTKEKHTNDVISLSESGWKIIIIWECDLKPQKREETLNSLIKKLKK